MKCCVGTCSRDAVVMVTFAATNATHPYCRFHSYWNSGNLRWKESAVSDIRRV